MLLPLLLFLNQLVKLFFIIFLLILLKFSIINLTRTDNLKYTHVKCLMSIVSAMLVYIITHALTIFLVLIMDGNSYKFILLHMH